MTVYQPVVFNKDTIRAIIAGLELYDKGLAHAVKEVEQFGIEDSRVVVEKSLVERIIEDAKNKLSSNDEFDVEYSYSPELMRMYKSCLILYLRRLEVNRSILVSEKRSLPKILLNEVDSRLAFVKDKLNLPVFKDVEPSLLFIDEQIVNKSVTSKESKDKTVTITTKTAVDGKGHGNVVTEEYLIIDEELRKRTLDLIGKNKDGLYDRPIREVAVLIEHMLKSISGLKDCTGVDLVSKSLNPENGLLIISSNKNEQDGIHLIFLGFFKFIRNDKAHNIVNGVTRERAIQIVLFGDYLLSLLEKSKLRVPTK